MKDKTVFSLPLLDIMLKSEELANIVKIKNKDNITLDDAIIENQIRKIEEEVRELREAKKSERVLELLDVIQASLNLFNMCDYEEKKEAHKSHIDKIKRRKWAKKGNITITIK